VSSEAHGFFRRARAVDGSVNRHARGRGGCRRRAAAGAVEPCALASFQPMKKSAIKLRPKVERKPALSKPENFFEKIP